MALYDLVWYCNAGDQSTTGHYAVTKWAASATIAAGALRRQLAAPTVGNERVFICIVAGTTGGTEPTWVLTRGAKTTDNTVTWQECTGASAVNGDLTNTANWTTAKAAGAPTLGAIIKRNNGASYQICTTAGAMGASEPSFSDTAGVTTTDSSAVWTSLGVVGNFTGGQAPHARLNNVFGANWYASGNTIYVGNNHAESQATAITYSAATTAPAIGRILCHNASGSYPPTGLTTGATISTTSTVVITLQFSGSMYLYGVTFKAGVGASTSPSRYIVVMSLSDGGWTYLDNCSLQIANTAANCSIRVGDQNNSYPNIVIFNNTTVSFAGAANAALNPMYVVWRWQNTGQILVSGSSVPTVFMQPSSATTVNVIELEALDLSQLTGKLVQFSNLSNGSILLKDCKLNSSVTIDTPPLPGLTVQLVRCDSSGTAYKSARYAYEGTEITETSITRVGGAADPAGQAQSRKIITTANAQWLRPFKAEPYAIWNAVTGGNVTVTVCGTINSGTLPNNDEVFMEVEYVSSSGSPLGTIKTTTKASLLAANAAVSSDSSTWNGGGSGAGWSPFKLVAVLSSPQPGMAGYIHVRVRAAKASTTVYIDPQIVLS